MYKLKLMVLSYLTPTYQVGEPNTLIMNPLHLEDCSISLKSLIDPKT